MERRKAVTSPPLIVVVERCALEKCTERLGATHLGSSLEVFIWKPREVLINAYPRRTLKIKFIAKKSPSTPKDGEILCGFSLEDIELWWALEDFKKQAVSSILTEIPYKIGHLMLLLLQSVEIIRLFGSVKSNLNWIYFNPKWSLSI